MVLLHDAVPATFAGDGLAVQLARLAEREFADVDTFLNLAAAFLDDLANLDSDDVTDIVLRCAQLLAP